MRVRDMTHSYTWHVSFIYLQARLNSAKLATRWRCDLLFRMCDTTQSYVYRGSFIYGGSFVYGTWLIHMCVVTWLIHTCGMTYSYVWHDSFFSVPWLPHRYARDRVTWLIHLCVSLCMWTGAHSYLWHDSSMCVITHSCIYNHNRTGWNEGLYDAVMWLIICVRRPIYICAGTYSQTHICKPDMMWQNAYICVRWLTHTCDMSHSHVCWDSFIDLRGTRWRCDITRWHVQLFRMRPGAHSFM